MDDVRVARQHVAAGQPDVLVQLRVEQEAAVVVGAGAVGAEGVYASGMVSVIRCSPSRSGSSLPFGSRGELGWASTSGGCVGWSSAPGSRGPVGRSSPESMQDAANGTTRAAAATASRIASARALHPGGQVIGRPASRCRWVWKTVCPAPGAGVEHEPVVVVALGGSDRGAPCDQLGRGLGVAGGELGGVRVVVARARPARGSAPAG